MKRSHAILWFTIVPLIGVAFGLTYAFVGLGILPVSQDVLIPWGNGVYGATFFGFMVTLLFVGRHAFQVHDRALMKALLVGVFAWLIVEALFSLYYQVFFNVAVDIALMLLIGFPLIDALRRQSSDQSAR